MPTYAATIAGVSQQIQEGWVLRELVNGRNTITFDVLSVTGSVTPDDNDEVIITENGTRIFGGLIDQPTHQDYAGIGGAAMTTRCSAVDFNAYADRRFVNGVIPAGTLKAALTIVVAYLTPYGVSLDPSQVDGPTLTALPIEFGRADGVLNQFSTLSDGYIWEIDYNKTARMFLPGSVHAPFDLVDGDGHAIGDITVEPSRNDYANKVWVLGGSGAHAVEWERHNGDGSARSWTMKVRIATLVGATVRVSLDGTTPIEGFAIGIYGVDTTIWTYDASDNTIHQSTDQAVIGALGYFEVTYTGLFPYATSADDGGSSANLVETVVRYPDIFDTAVIDSLAPPLLAQALAKPRTLKYTTLATGLKPGMVQAVTVPSHGITAVDFMIVEIESRAVGVARVERTLTLIEGTLNVTSWRDVYRTWSGGGVSASASGVVISGSGSGSGSTTSGPQQMFLGGSRNTSVAPSPAAWTPIPDYVPITAQTGFNGRVRAHVWARQAGTSVTLRLYNVTDATATTASPVTSQAPTEVTLTQPIIAGKTYRLEVLSSLAGSGVYAIGVLENV